MELKRFRASPPDFESNLTCIYLGSKYSTMKNIDHLRNCPDLKELAIKGYKANTIDIASLHDCPGLESLQISDAQNIESLDLMPLSGMTELKELFLVDIPNLTSLDLSPLSKCSSLKKLWIEKNSIKELDIQPILELENLERLDIKKMPLTKIEGDSSESSIPLKILYLYDVHNLQHLSLDFLSNAKLEGIGMHYSNITKLDLSPISSQTRIQAIYLNHHKLTEIDLSPLAGYSELEVLELACNQLSHIDLTPLQTCTSLRSLDLSKNSIQDIDLAPLSPLQLENLFLSHNPLQEVDITHVISPELHVLTFGPDTVAKASKTMKSSTRYGKEIGSTGYKSHVFTQYYHGTRNVGTRTEPRLLPHEKERYGLDVVEWY
ncbi:MAG: leucine-rich repeat domain-containing protein [Candidatus Thorarchaeota archaeon]